MSENLLVTPKAKIQDKIYTTRSIPVMLDKDLAILYEVDTKVFNQAVKRNVERFPDKFRFQLTQHEYEEFLRSQNVTSKGRGGRRYLPYKNRKIGKIVTATILCQ